ncbi:MAG TPA: dihydrofolate reductase family protein [Dehalococcoidia bacterium]|nr:dihydrofolate reductase family protein [Dehalococcoidia bacterium]
MAKLIYAVHMSLDGYFEDADGNFDWTEPNEEQHRFVNDLLRPVGTHLYGRRMYETMAVWETDPALAASSPVYADFAELWQAGDKVVYSRTLAEAWTARTRLEREFDLNSVVELKGSAASDILIAGPELASNAIKAGLVDEYHFLVVPVVVGSGKSALPPGLPLQLELLDERRFSNGVVHLRYASAG